MAYTNTYVTPTSTVTIPSVGSGALLGDISAAADSGVEDLNYEATQSNTALNAAANAETAKLNVATQAGTAQAGALAGTANQNLATYQAPDAAAVNLVKDSSTYRKPEDTVATQITQLLNIGNPYMQTAEVRAKEAAQKYGLLGSSMSVGAAHRAAIESGLPIAQQDAETAAKFGMQQQAAENQIGVIGAETAYSGALMNARVGNENIQAGLQSQLAMQQKQQEIAGQYGQNILASTAELEGQRLNTIGQIKMQEISGLKDIDMQELQGRWNFVTADSQARLEAALEEKINAQKIDAEIASAVRTSSSELIQNYQISVEKLLADPEFLKLGGTAVKNTLNNMLKTTQASVQFLADSAGINLDPYFKDFLAGAAFTTTIPKT